MQNNWLVPGAFVKLPKCIVQLNEREPSSKRLNFLTYVDEKMSNYWSILNNSGLSETGWDKPEPPGRNHPKFNKFLLQFEYEENK